ncbi:MAG TPA: hypothetical protein VHZ55_30960 [Bryobacteraceae bacterium]|jgi:hypothetical protein|nr:hypothetical protein [Bryobacteraceae bacterium]
MIERFSDFGLNQLPYRLRNYGSFNVLQLTFLQQYRQLDLEFPCCGVSASR